MKRRIWLVIAGIAALIVVIYIYVFVLGGNGDDRVTPAEGWRTETVDDSGWVGIDPVIAVDSQGNPHISYYDQGNRDLKYAYLPARLAESKRAGKAGFDGSSWQVETVDSEGDVGEESGIAIDRNGNPHISYISVTDDSPKYAMKADGSWSTEIIDQFPEDYHTVSTSVAIDSKGRPHVGYNGQQDGSEDKENGGDTEPGFVRYAFWDGKSWKVEKVATGGEDVYLALGPDDIPHLSFRQDEDSQKSIHHATKVSGKWRVGTVDKSSEVGGDTGIGVDSQNRPHVVYHDYGKGAIKYAKWNGGSWDIQTVASDIGSEEGLKIFVDANDKPHVIFSDTKREKLMYAVLESGSWVKEVVSRMGNPSIAVDHLGRVHVAHNQSAEGDPKEYLPDYTGPDTEIEILMYSIKE